MVSAGKHTTSSGRPGSQGVRRTNLAYRRSSVPLVGQLGPVDNELPQPTKRRSVHMGPLPVYRKAARERQDLHRSRAGHRAGKQQEGQRLLLRLGRRPAFSLGRAPVRAAPKDKRACEEALLAASAAAAAWTQDPVVRRRARAEGQGGLISAGAQLDPVA
ncbi:unnamed protein product [Prorocentrum cordatum]|uniref:Uncharacterized protein n=1 Tax=Prorocentrum cordatum TaxID=2364126 RepID=A0ABN9R4T2_9DINO|nr:unnamed protein product [Polarella glacialis]